MSAREWGLLCVSSGSIEYMDVADATDHAESFQKWLRVVRDHPRDPRIGLAVSYRPDNSQVPFRVCPARLELATSRSSDGRSTH